MVARTSKHFEPRARQWSRDEYYRMAELGWFRGQRVELIGGEVIEMSPQGNPHYVAINLGSCALQAAFGPDYWIRTQGPLSPAGDSEPEPDIAVVKGNPRDYARAQAHPGAALLIVEVSDSSLRYDRTRKASLYASMGVGDYWILNLVEDCLEVRRDPRLDPDAEFGWAYASIVVLRRGQAISPLAKPDASIRVDDLLP